MKPKEYVKKYAGHFDQDGLMRDLVSDFLAQIEFHKSRQWNRSVFLNLVRQLADKYNLIAFSFPQLGKALVPLFTRRLGWREIQVLRLRLTADEINGPAWFKLYQSVILKIYRDEFAEEIEEDAAAAKAYAQQKEEERRHMDAFKAHFQQRMFDDAFRYYALLSLFGRLSAPVSAFEQLGLTVDASRDDIVSHFRERAHVAHPDKGGSEEAMKALIEARNQCLAFIDQKAA